MKRVLSAGDITAAVPNDDGEDYHFSTQPKTRSKKAKKSNNLKNVAVKPSVTESASNVINTKDSSITSITNNEVDSLKLTVDRLLAQSNLQSKAIQLLTDRLNFFIFYVRCSRAGL